MKSKIFLVSVIFLIILIGFIRYKIFSMSKNNFTDQKPQVKSAQTANFNHLTIPDLNFNKIKIPPKKINSYTEPKILSDSYILMDSETFYPLAEKNSAISVPIASTTKIMSAIIVLEDYNLEDIVTVSSDAVTQIGSDTFLKTNEKISVENLLYALLIKSGNDAAMALAEHYQDGGNEGFVGKMNKKVRFLELKSTEFKDPAGLDDSGHASAFDLAVIASYAMKKSKFVEIVKSTEKTISSADGKYEYKLETSNRLIKPDEPLYLPAAIGIKTGFTPDAGHCLVSAAKKDNDIIIGVVLHTNENTVEASAKESKKLLDWGFSNYTWD